MQNKSVKKQIILNCLPPIKTNSPSPAMSILKSHLSSRGYFVKILYWNLLLSEIENDFVWGKSTATAEYRTLLYAAYLSRKYNNISVYNEVKTILRTFAPILLNESKNFYDEHIAEFTLKLDAILDKQLECIDFSDTLYFGFGMKIDQWVLASIIAGKIKRLAPNIPIVIGGIATPSAAKTFLEQFDQFDIALWGEGEKQLENLTIYLLEKLPVQGEFNVANAYYRENNCIKRSPYTNTIYSDLSESNQYPDFHDYFDWRNNTGASDSPLLLIEGGRGCHWNKCHFCYLNYGYKYRLKNVDKISQEIRHLIKEYGIYRFEFLDNDIIGNDFERFDSLLEEFIKIKREYPKFTICAVEIITLGLTYQTIKKMSIAGITGIQIGYESSCDNLLKKINKKNTFASNINCIKHSLRFGINLFGVNVIYNLLEETEDDIHDSIENLRFFRFILNNHKYFIHTPVPLSINSTSKYFKAIKNNKHNYTPILLPYQKVFLEHFTEDAKWNILDFTLNRKNQLWDHFNSIQFHYIKNLYSYDFVKKNDSIIYSEYFNGDIIESIEFNINDNAIEILKYSYDKVVSLDDLLSIIGLNIHVDKIKETIDELFEKGLLYRTSCYSEIVAVVNPQNF